jgi:hypothetical protein
MPLLTTRHTHDWPVIDEVAAACVKPETRESADEAPAWPPPLASSCSAAATTLGAQAFHRMLDLTLPRTELPPWDTIPWVPRIHLALFVHRVEGLVPRVSLLPRDTWIEARLRAKLSPEFAWVRAEGCPAQLADARPCALRQPDLRPRRQRRVVQPALLLALLLVDAEQGNDPLRRVPVQALRQFRRNAAHDDPPHAGGSAAASAAG